MSVHWKDWCWSWNSSTLAIWYEELTHLKRPWCWKRLKAEGEGDDRGWDGWMASLTQWTWVWINSLWWTGRPGLLQSMGSQRVRHDWVTDLNRTELNMIDTIFSSNSSVQFSCSVVSDSLTPHESQHARPPCPSSTPGVHSDSRPSSQWCHLAISSSVVPFSSCPQSLPASESFPVSQLFEWGGQSTAVSALASFLPRNPRDDLLQNGLVGSPCSPRDSQESFPTPQFKSINSLVLSFLHSPTFTSIHDHRKNHSLDCYCCCC